MKVEALLARWPAAARVFIAHRMACLGCVFAPFHTTRQALEIYDLDASDFLSDLLTAIDPEPDRIKTFPGEEKNPNA